MRRLLRAVSATRSTEPPACRARGVGESRCGLLTRIRIRVQDAPQRGPADDHEALNTLRESSRNRQPRRVSRSWPRDPSRQRGGGSRRMQMRGSMTWLSIRHQRHSYDPAKQPCVLADSCSEGARPLVRLFLPRHVAPEQKRRSSSCKSRSRMAISRASNSPSRRRSERRCRATGGVVQTLDKQRSMFEGAGVSGRERHTHRGDGIAAPNLGHPLRLLPKRTMLWSAGSVTRP